MQETHYLILQSKKWPQSQVATVTTYRYGMSKNYKAPDANKAMKRFYALAVPSKNISSRLIRGKAQWKNWASQKYEKFTAKKVDGNFYCKDIRSGEKMEWNKVSLGILRVFCWRRKDDLVRRSRQRVHRQTKAPVRMDKILTAHLVQSEYQVGKCQQKCGR